MKLGQLFDTNLLYESALLKKDQKGVLVLDIDDTILTAKNIYIHKILPDGKVLKLTPEQYANDPEAKTNKKAFSYEEFRDPKIVRNSIETGIPIIKNLRIMDDHIAAGWDIAILTARGLEDIVYKSLSNFLLWRDPQGELKTIKGVLAREMVTAINDETKVYEGANDAEKKANILRELSKKYTYVKFVDDDDKNIAAVKALRIPNVQVIKAWKKETEK